jgi:hypothetical protein
MANLWSVPESCSTLPGDNFEERKRAATELIRILRDPETQAPPGDSREEWTSWIKKNLYELLDLEAYGVSPPIANSTRGEYLTLDVTVEEKTREWRIILAVESELDD